jgi:hypothetical protein
VTRWSACGCASRVRTTSTRGKPRQSSRRVASPITVWAIRPVYVPVRASGKVRKKLAAAAPQRAPTTPHTSVHQRLTRRAVQVPLLL